jgi:hypothetical protein
MLLNVGGQVFLSVSSQSELEAIIDRVLFLALSRSDPRPYDSLDLSDHRIAELRKSLLHEVVTHDF